MRTIITVIFLISLAGPAWADANLKDPAGTVEVVDGDT